MDTSRTASRTEEIGGGQRTLDDWIRVYRNDRATNTAVNRAFAALANKPSWLRAHRDWVQANGCGFGDRAVHQMWRLVLEHLSDRDGPVRCLEIGTLKGQVISLWTLIGVHLGFAVDVTALGPFAGRPPGLVRNGLSGRSFSKVGPAFRAALAAGTYPDGDCVADCKRIFTQFGLDYCDVEIVRGLSSDAAILHSFEARSFDLIYIDGEHSDASAAQDVINYSPMVTPGGFLVIDAAPPSLQMDVPYRGLPGPSKGAGGSQVPGFANVLNVGYHRVLQKI